ncbi:MAG: ABC transporter substrate-binding protein [Thermomicrobiales bacterium]|nr:MAG: ABC transporter substrate-binding protein [Thermomicrobiales bacterium]
MVHRVQSEVGKGRMMARREIWRQRMSRRALNMVMALGSATLAGGFVRPGLQHAQAAARLRVLAPLPPDPAPPGVAPYALDALAQWKEARNVRVTFDAHRWPDLHDTIAAAFANGDPAYDVLYTAGWIPEFASSLAPLNDRITGDLRADLPPSSFNATTWNGRVLGVPFTISVLILFYNLEHFNDAGLDAPPRTWDELKAAAEALTRDGRYGWVQNYGAPEGSGGVASYFMAFLQQAGGTMYHEDGLPAFNSEEGIAALQCMMDLMLFTHPGSMDSRTINEATAIFMSGQASMMMNWPVMWQPAQDPATSRIVGSLRVATLPAGPAGTASIDSADAWSVATSSLRPDLAWEFVAWMLSPEVQKQQALATPWLPIRRSVLADPEVQQAAPHAAAVLEQASHPYTSFVTPGYEEITLALGAAIQDALRGHLTAQEALARAEVAVTEIIQKRHAS